MPQRFTGLKYLLARNFALAGEELFQPRLSLTDLDVTLDRLLCLDDVTGPPEVVRAL